MDAELPSSFSLDSTPKDHTPKKLHQYPAKDVATELTLMDSELLRDIRPEELHDLAWTKKGTKVEGVMCSASPYGLALSSLVDFLPRGFHNKGKGQHA